MANEEEQAELNALQPADQTLEDGAQEAANQTAQDSAEQQADTSAEDAATQTGQDGADHVEEEGLKAGIVAEKKKRQEAEALLQASKNQNVLLQQQVMQSAQQVQQSQVQENSYAQAIRELGLQGQEYLSESERIEVYKRKDQLDTQKLQAQNMYAQNAQFVASHTDFAEVVGIQGPAGFIPSTELQILLTKKPHLYSASAKAIYDAVMENRKLTEYEKMKVVMTEKENRQKVEAVTSPMSPAAAGGGGTVGEDYSSAEKVAATERRVAAGEFDK